MVPIAHDTTLLTRIVANRQGQHLPMSAVAAYLCGICRRHFDHLSPNFFRFSHKYSQKCAPGCVCYLFVQSVLAACTIWVVLSRYFVLLMLGPFEHVAHDQGLDGDQPEAIDQLVPPGGKIWDDRSDPRSRGRQSS